MEAKNQNAVDNCNECAEKGNCWCAHDARAKDLCPDGAYNSPGRGCPSFFLDSNVCHLCVNRQKCLNNETKDLVYFEQQVCDNCKSKKHCDLYLVFNKQPNDFKSWCENWK